MENKTQITVEAVSGSQIGFEQLDKRIADLSAKMEVLSAKFERGISGGGKLGKTMENTSGATAGLIHMMQKLGIQMETIDLYFISGFKVLGIFRLLGFIKESVLEAENLKNAFKGIELAADIGGFKMVDIQEKLNELLKMGRVRMDDLAESMRNLLKKGYTPEQAQTIISTLIKSGTVFGTQANMPLGEAVKRATEGILQDLSRLVDATRLTKNLDRIWADYARSIGQVAANLTDAERRLAFMNYIIQEAIGLDAKYKEANSGVTESLGKLSIEYSKLKNLLGEGLAPSASLATKGMTEAIKTGKEAVVSTQVIGLTFRKMFLEFLDMSAPLASIFEYFKLIPGFDPFKYIGTTAEKASEQIHKINKEIDVLQSKLGKESWYYKMFGIRVPPVVGAASYKEVHPQPPFVGGAFGKTRMPWETQWWMEGERVPYIAENDPIAKELFQQSRKFDESLRRRAKQLADIFGQPIEDSISDALTDVFTGEKGKKLEDIIMGFWRGISRGIGDLLAESFMKPIRDWMQTIFSSVLQGASSGGIGSFLGGSSIPFVGGMPPPEMGSPQVSVSLINQENTPSSVARLVEESLIRASQNNGRIKKIIRSMK